MITHEYLHQHRPDISPDRDCVKCGYPLNSYTKGEMCLCCQKGGRSVTELNEELAVMVQEAKKMEFIISVKSPIALCPEARKEFARKLKDAVSFSRLKVTITENHPQPEKVCSLN